MKNFKSFFLGEHFKTKLNVFCFEKNDLLADKNLAKEIVNYCETLQDLVWTKKFETAHNSIDQDILLLAWDDVGNRPAGFYSASYFEDKNRIFLDHSDGMFLPEYWNKGLLSYFFETANKIGASKFNTNKIINIVASGYIHIFTYFENRDYFKRLDWPFNIEDLSAVKKIIRRSFDKLKIEENGIIRSGWKHQKNKMKDVWPKDLAIKYSLPHDVNYFNGDVLVKLYIYKSDGR